MPISINDFNEMLEEHIHIGDVELKEKLGRIRRGDVVVFDRKRDNGSIIELFKIFQPNWIGGKKKTLFYNMDENIRIENYLFAVSMLKEVPDDIYTEIIDNSTPVWYQYKQQMNDKNIYIKNGTDIDLISDLSNADYKLGLFDLILIITNKISNSEMTYLKRILSKNSCIILLL